MPNYKMINGERIQLTAQEETEYKQKQTAFQAALPQDKLKQIKSIRLEKLQETDWWVLRGDITTAQSNFRQALRDIPSTYSSNEPKNIVFDELGNVKVNGNIVITKPSE